MTPDPAESLVRYALEKMTEDEHTAALLALRHYDPDAIRKIHAAEIRMAGGLRPPERERLSRVTSRYNEAAREQDDWDSCVQEFFSRSPYP